MIEKGWEVISRYPDYMINENGEIYSTLRRKILKHSYTGSTNNRPTKIPIVCLRYRLGKKTYAATETVARLVAETFIGLPNENTEGYVVYHKDGNACNNNVNNLCWCRYEKCPSMGRKGRSVIATNSLTGETFEFDSVSIAAGALSGCTSGIYGSIAFGKKYKGYTFEYKEE